MISEHVRTSVLGSDTFQATHGVIITWYSATFAGAWCKSVSIFDSCKVGGSAFQPTEAILVESGQIFLSVFSGRNIRQISQILLISWNFGKTQMKSVHSIHIYHSPIWRILLSLRTQKMLNDNRLWRDTWYFSTKDYSHFTAVKFYNHYINNIYRGTHTS